MEEILERSCCIRGYHVYTWEASIGEALTCEGEPGNAANRYAVAVKKDSSIVGYLPRKLTRVCSLFLHRGGTIGCTVTGQRKIQLICHKEGMKFHVLWFSRPPLKKFKNKRRCGNIMDLQTYMIMKQKVSVSALMTQD